MARFIVRLLEGLPPGVAIAMLTIPAFFLPFFWDRLGPVGKGIGISSIVLLVALEISVIYRERARQNQVWLLQITRFDEIRTLHDQHASALERVRRTVSDGSLKDRATRLSESILQFVYQRLENTPTYTGGYGTYTSALWHQNLLVVGTDIIEHEADTAAKYRERYSAKVLAIIEEFEAMQLNDEELRNAALNPSGSYIIRSIGQRMGELAERIGS